MSTFEIDLPAGLASFVRRQVEAGLYDDEADVIRDAVRRLAGHDEAKLEAVKKALATGVAEAESGAFYDGDMSDLLRDARAAKTK